MNIELENGIRLKINKKKHTAKIIKSENVFGNVLIPEYYESEGEKYYIVSVEADAFSFKHIDYLIFHENSRVKTFKQSSFAFAFVIKFQIPASLEYLNFGWCQFLYDVNQFEISPKNTKFTYHDNKYLLGKSSPNSEDFDALYFARSDIENAIIPPQVRVIKSESFYSHKKLKSMIFTDDSQLKSIERGIFYEAPIEKLVLPSSLEYISEDCFDSISVLSTIEVSPKNSLFTVLQNNYLVRKSDKNSENFDIIVFARRDIKKAQIPSSIKYISKYSFDRCNDLESIEFCKNSQLQSIGYSSFSYIKGPKNLIFPEKLRDVGFHSFFSAKNIRFIQFLSDSVSLQSSCFFLCNNLELISFENAKEIWLDNSFKGMECDPMIFIRSDAVIHRSGPCDKFCYKFNRNPCYNDFNDDYSSGDEEESDGEYNDDYY